jgi:ubiquinol-cytochrome c reductase cytochrome c1 subunit
MMKKLLVALLVWLPTLAIAAGGGASECPQDPAPVDLRDKAQLQRGAKYYVNYCLGCHSLKYQRYGRLGEDLEIPKELVEQNLMFTGEQVGNTMNIAMPAADAEKWFGVLPPDLSLKARVRGTDWIYNYLRSFHKDDSRPYGVNNLCFPDVGMPHVMADLQGIQDRGHETRLIDDEQKEFYIGLEVVEPGSLTPEEYDQVSADLAAFLTYVGEPVQVERQDLGWKVLLFIFIFFIFAYALKREYWKDIH